MNPIEQTMVVDLHAHYAMHLMDEYHHSLARVLRWVLARPAPNPPATLSVEALHHYYDEQHRRRRLRPLRALLLWLFRWINKYFNYATPSSEPGVTLKSMEQGGVGVILSPLIDPLNEFGDLPVWLFAMFVTAIALAVTTVLNYVSLFCALTGHSDYATKHACGYLALILFVLLLALVTALALCSWLASTSDRGFDELPGSQPRGNYLLDVWRQYTMVEQSISGCTSSRVVHCIEKLEEALNDKKIAVIHCVEGGVQLGACEEEITRNVATFAKAGIAYVTLAHLFWRRVATNAPSIPPLSDPWYRRLAHQPQEGLTNLGRAAVTAMFHNGVLIDVTHMSQQAIDETFELLTDLECGGPPVPVIATHMACRFGKYEYNLSEETIKRIWKRNGVMGVIFCDHWMSDGRDKRERRTKTRTFEIIKNNIDRIESLTNSQHHCVAIGSDLDGFVKPMLCGLEDMGCMRELAQWVVETYKGAAKLILHENALRVLRSAWRIPR